MKLRDLRSADVQNAITADGKGKMPACKSKLNEAELNAVVAFMRTMAKK